jgi:hypothetical protein
MDLQSLRRLRDEILSATPAGRTYIDLYHEHASELVRILLMDEGLRVRSVEVLHEFLPEIRGLLGEAGGRERILTASRLWQLDALVADIARHADPALRRAIETIRRQMVKYQGKTLRDMWAEE